MRGTGDLDYRGMEIEAASATMRRESAASRTFGSTADILRGCEPDLFDSECLEIREQFRGAAHLKVSPTNPESPNGIAI